MENRYLFRGKRIDNEQWVEGFYFCMTHPDGRHTHHFIIPLGADLSLGTPIEKIQVEVDPSTICRCTELKDKNGTLIWEHDIVKPHTTKVTSVRRLIIKCYADTNDLGNDLFAWYEVLWHENYHCWWLSEIYVEEGEYLHEFYSYDIEVIGNTFDNPELLEKENRKDSCA